jgi:spore germination protein YaaH
MQRLNHLLIALVVVGASVAPVSVSASAAVARTGHAAQLAPRVMQQAADLAAQPASASMLAASRAPHLATIPLAARTPTPLQREVFGFVNSGNLGNSDVGYTTWNFGLLSTVAFFGLQVNSGDGNLVTTNTGWAVYHSQTMTNFINTAHANGTRVIVSLNLHDFSTSPTNQVCQGLIAANTVNTISQAVNQETGMGIDGINIDYEGADTTCANGLNERPQLVAFTQNLRAAMPKGAYLAIDTYSGSAEDNLEFFDIPGLAPSVDSFFVMAYDMDFANYGSPPLNCTSFCFNPISPLTTYQFNVTKSMTQYLALVPGSKIILGQPYYGRKGCVPSLNVANQYPDFSKNFVAPTYLYAANVLPDPTVSSYSVHRDAGDNVSRWDTWYASDFACNREQFWDDTYSLGTKYDLVNADNLRGVGLFTLDYGGSAPELWDELAAKFTTTTAWDSLGSGSAFSPDASSASSTRLDAFIGASDSALYQTTWNGTSWSPWAKLGGILTSSPAAVSNGMIRTDVFVRGSDNQLYQMHWNGTAWSPWSGLGGLLTSGPDADIRAGTPAHVDVWVTGSDSQLYHKWSDDGGNTFGAWQALGGVLTSDPGSVSWSAGRVDVFVRGTDNQLYHKFWDISIGWSNWEALGGFLLSGPDATSCTPGHLDVFVVGTDHGLWRKGWNGSAWSAWVPQGGRFTSDPAAVCRVGTTTIDLFERGVDNAVWHASVPAS